MKKIIIETDLIVGIIGMFAGAWLIHFGLFAMLSGALLILISYLNWKDEQDEEEDDDIVVDIEAGWNNAYEKENDDILCVYDHHAGFVAGVEWMKEQITKEGNV